MAQILRAQKLIAVIHKGSSLPIVVKAYDHRPYLVKLQGTAEGPTTLVVEWLATYLAYLLQLPVPVPQLMTVDKTLTNIPAHQEIRELIVKSSGVNLAFPFFMNTTPFDITSDASLPRRTLDDLFLFDCLLLNIDRTPPNPNLFHADGKLWATDYGSSMLLKQIVTNAPYTLKTLLPEIKRNPLYRTGIDPSTFIAKLKAVNPKALLQIAGLMPSAWFMEPANQSIAGRIKLADDLHQALQQAETRLQEMLPLLHHLSIPTEEERLAKAQKNSAALRSKLKRP